MISEKPEPPRLKASVPAGDARLDSLDILRGLALAGMILVHFHQKMRIEASGLEDLIGWGVYILVEQKAWGIFAFLFGVGFAVLLRRLDARGVPAAPIYLRRLAVLAALGVIARVGFGFAILFTYAMWGVVLLLVRNWPTRALLALAIVAAMAGPMTAEVSGLGAWLRGVPQPPDQTWPLVQAEHQAAAQASYSSLLAARWRLFVASTPGGWSGLLPDSNLALFILGLLSVRHGVIDDPRRQARTIQRWMAFGALSWLVSWTVLRQADAIAIPDVGWPLAMGLGLIRDQWLCFAYIGAVLLLLAKRPEWNRRLSPIGQAGRMALTNYMLQIVVLDALASGYGLGVKVRPLLYLPATLMLFGTEVVLSTLWLSRFRYGPLEWIWRGATYLRLEPIRRNNWHCPA